MIWFLQQPAVVVGVVTLVVTVGVALLGLVLFRRLVPQARLAKSMSVTGHAFTLVGVLYPLVAAFALQTVWDHHHAAEEATEREASAVADLLNISEVLPPGARAAVQRQTLAYAQDVIGDELPRMKQGLPIERRSEQLRSIKLALSSSEPTTQTEIDSYWEAVRALEEVSRSRSARTAGSEAGSTSQLDAELWVLLIGGAVISLVFIYMISADDFVIHAVCVALTAALVALVGYLILTLDRPFVGSLAVSPDSYQRVIDNWLLQPPPR